MFRRLLAFALAGCMVFESAPITSYAADTQHSGLYGNEQTVESETDGLVDVSTESELTSGLAKGTHSDGDVTGGDVSNGDVTGGDITGGDEEQLAHLTKHEDGTYSFETSDYKVSLKAEAGVGHLRFGASLEASGGVQLS
ncbi:MAG: hypothetical protein NC413_07870 [Muribaculum sp.]|nr:hypothetical protein [Muribaculum sp.]